ncbi:MAG TPA: aldo/keto reductase [Pyrinomonadaceae bacterium]|nr:aldo/keto reductase [Pyrinomonadaceae bacterium]
MESSFGNALTKVQTKNRTLSRTYVVMIYRTLGSTGEKVSAIGIGGWHVGLERLAEQFSIRIVRTALDGGINFLDNCWDYNDGASEIRMGQALRDGYRDKAFLMTKIDGRSKQEATKQLEESLKRLGVDYIDLVQHHEVIRYDDPHRIFHKNGANAALVDAKKSGKLRYIGFTGHKDPRIHLYMLELAKQNYFKFDAVQMPLNVMDAHYRSFEKLVLPELLKEKIGVLGMKSMGSGAILKSGIVTAMECLHYALSLPTDVVITGIESLELLEQAFEAARTFQTMTDEARDSLLARTAKLALTGEFEPFKTCSLFDATALNPKWLGEEPLTIQQWGPE